MRASGRATARPTWTQLIAFCLVAAILTSLLTSVLLTNKYKNLLAERVGDYSKLDEIRQLIDKHYVGEYSNDELMDMLAYGYINGINDRWAYYTSAENLELLYQDKSGTYAGVGMSVTLDGENGMISIIEVYEDSPAQEAGIRAMDKLYAVEDEPVAGLGLEATAAKVRGEPGTIVKLTIWREGIYYNYDVERRIVERRSVKSEVIESDVGYIRISEFTTAAADQFTENLNVLINEIKIKSLILDVRNNPGGSLATLLTALDTLMPKGTMFKEVDKAGNFHEYTSDDFYFDIPMVVLSNEYSYSAAEYFAAVLQEQNLAFIIGNPTTGKGEGQQTFELSDGSAITFSVIKYYTPNNVSIGENGGIKPDLDIFMTDEQVSMIGNVEYDEDPQILAALDYLRKDTN